MTVSECVCCTALHVLVPLEQSHTWRPGFFIYTIFFIRSRNACFQHGIIFAVASNENMYSLKTESQLGAHHCTEALSGSQQPSTQELTSNSQGANCLIGSALTDFGVVVLEFSWKIDVYATNMLVVTSDISWVLVLNGRCWQLGWVKTFETFPALFGFSIRFFSLMT